MLRDTIQQRCIHEYFLDNSELIKPLFTEYARSTTFEIASDPIQTLKYLLRQHKTDKTPSNDRRHLIVPCPFLLFPGICSACRISSKGTVPHIRKICASVRYWARR